jgi:hypothetical protein
MLSRAIPAAVVMVSLCWAMSFAQLKKDEPDSKATHDVKPASKTDPKADGTNFELHMTDGTVMRVALLDKSMAVVTKYGRLVVPASDIRRLEFGFRYPIGVAEKIDQAIVELGSPDFKTREEAEKNLTKIGLHSIPALRRAVRSDNPEVVHRSEAALKLLESKLEEGKPELNDFDLVETTEFTVKGRIEVSSMSVRTKYFGDTTVNFTDIRSFHAIGTSSHVELSLDAAKYGKMSQSDWLETSINVSSGQSLEVSASGQVDQWPQAPGQYMVGPEGLANNGNRLVALGGMGGSSGLPGQVIGRIGATGTSFPIGASYKGKVTETGKLYLRIGASPWNCPSTGSYKVIVNVRN